MSKQVIRNMIYAFTAQGISLLLSLTVSFVIPKVLGVEEFSYWQLFLFYSSYLGFFHFGLNDGLYLRKGGEKYENLNFAEIGSQLKAAFIVHSMMAVLIIAASLIGDIDWNRRFIWILIAIYLPLFNAAAYYNIIFQAVNRIKLFSLAFSIDKIFIIVAVIFLLIIKCTTFTWYIVAYVAGMLVTLVFCAVKAREITRSQLIPFKMILPELLINISVGVKLMLSNIASILIIGIGRFIVDNIWGIAAFGKFSFSISISSIFLLFISQISNVLFPTLRNTNELNMKKFYNFSRDLIGILFAGVFLAYMPIKYALGIWLPQYSESLSYLALLLPLCTYDGKMNMLCSTYFKVLRKEKLLLQINGISVAVSLVFSLISGYLIHNIYAVVLSMVIVVAFRSIVSEIYLARMMAVSVTKSLIIESLLVIIFMTCTWFINPLAGFIIYAVIYALYLAYNRSTILRIFKSTQGFLQESQGN